MNKLAAFLFSGALGLLVSCMDTDTPKTAPANESAPQAQQIQTGSFSPPQNGLISPETASKYVESSTALFLLARQWIERMDKTTDAQERILILGGFEAARDQVVRKIGLSGINEFNWISEVGLKNPENKKILEAAGLQLGSN